MEKRRLVYVFKCGNAKLIFTVRFKCSKFNVIYKSYSYLLAIRELNALKISVLFNCIHTPIHRLHEDQS